MEFSINEIEAFLIRFYEIISFEINNTLNKKDFRELFVPSAVLIEKDKDEVNYKSVEEHINFDKS
jgi:hypothetical protein